MIALLLAAAVAGAAPAPYPAVRDDARAELLAGLRLLAGDQHGAAGFFLREGAYEAELARRLKPFARHPAVERWQELEKGGLGYVAAYQWILALGPVPGLERLGPPPPALVDAAGGELGAEEFRLLLADLAAASGFRKLFDETAPLRAPLVDSARAQAAKLGMREDAERWARLRLPAYELVVTPFMEPTVAATLVRKGPDGSVSLLGVTGPEEFSGQVVLRLGNRRGSLWAEALREALRPAAAAVDWSGSKALFAGIETRCAQDWNECALRQLAYAAGARLLARAGEKAAAEEAPIKYARVGMPHLAFLAKELEAYEKAPGAGLAAALPKLAGRLAELAASKPAASPFSGSMADALADPSPCVLIAPEKAGRELEAALFAFKRDRRLCDALTPAQALAAPLNGRAVFAVGTLAGNPWLAARWKDLNLPFSFVPSGLAVGPRPGEAKGRVIAGEAALASLARNPDDPYRPAVLFAGSSPEAAVRALARFSGRFDWETWEGASAAVGGSYEKSRLPWRPK